MFLSPWVRNEGPIHTGLCQNQWRRTARKAYSIEQTRMISETAGLIVSLGTDLGHELFIVAGIVNAGEHKVVPHEDAVFVTGSHEGVGSVDTAAPDAHHRHIGIAAGSDKPSMERALPDAYRTPP